MWPNLSNIENIPLIVLCICLRHHLYMHGPSCLVSLCNMIEKIPSSEVRVLPIHFGGFGCLEVLYTGVSFKVYFDKEGLVPGIDKFEGMTAVSVHVSEAVGSASVAEHVCYLVDSLWYIAPEIPYHIRVFQVGLRVTLLCMDEIWELHWVTDEENWGVVASHVPVSFFSVEFYSKSSRVSLLIS